MVVECQLLEVTSWRFLFQLKSRHWRLLILEVLLEPEWWGLRLLVLRDREWALAGERRLRGLTREVLQDDARGTVHVRVGPHRLLTFLRSFDLVKQRTHVFNRWSLVGLVSCQIWRSEEGLLKFWCLDRLLLQKTGKVKDRLQDYWLECWIVLADFPDAFDYLSCLGGRFHVYYLLCQFFNIDSDLIS